MEILTLLKANIKHKKGAFISISVLMFIITLSLIIVISNNDNISNNLEKSLNAVDTGDFISFISSSQYTKEIQDKLITDKNVERIRDVNALMYIKKFMLDQKESLGNPLALVKWRDSYSVFTKNLDGFMESPPCLASGEIYVPISFQAMYGCDIGSEFVISTKNGNKKFVIKGFVEEPVIGAYFIGIKQLFISEEDYKTLSATSLDNEEDPEPKLLSYHIIHVFQSDDCDMTIVNFRKEVNRVSSLIDNSFAALSIEDSMKYTKIFTDIGSGILYVFIILLFVIVLIVMGHSISTGIEMDYVNLGILKSQGLTKGKIRIVFLLQYVFAELIGAILGVFMGIPFTKLLGRVFQPITGILASSEISLLKCGCVIVGLILLGCIFVYAMTAKVGKISPVSAISESHGEVYFDSRMHTPISPKLLSISLAFRQFTSNKLRYIGTILIVSILVFFMMSMTILANAMGTEEMNEAMGGFNYDIVIEINNTLKNEDIDNIKADILEISPLKMSLFSLCRYFCIDGSEFYCNIYDDPKLFKSILKGRAPLYENEIVITEILAEEIEKNIGDTVTISYRDSKADYMISGFYQSSYDVGKCFGMSLKASERLEHLMPSQGFFLTENSDKNEEIVDMLNSQYSHLLKAKVREESSSINDLVQEALDAIAGIIYLVSAIFALVVVNMVCSKTFLKERCDLGICKAIGFTTRQLRIQFAVRFFILSIIGSAIGILFSLMFNNKLLSTLLRATGVTNFTTKYTAVTIIAPIVLICGCFFLFSYLASKKIKSVEVRELIIE